MHDLEIHYGHGRYHEPALEISPKKKHLARFCPRDVESNTMLFSDPWASHAPPVLASVKTIMSYFRYGEGCAFHDLNKGHLVFSSTGKMEDISTSFVTI